MPSEPSEITAHAVLKTAEGTSVLDAHGAITAENVAQFKVGPDRVARAVGALEALGFAVVSGNGMTLSVTGAPQRFKSVFGIDQSARAPIHARTIPGDLADLLADVFVPQPPEFFP